MKVWENIVACAIVSAAAVSTSTSGQFTYSPRQPADAMADHGIVPTCLLPEDQCPRNWHWAPTSKTISCAPGYQGYRIPGHPNGNRYFCCDGAAQWRYVYLNGQTVGTEAACGGLAVPTTP